MAVFVVVSNEEFSNRFVQRVEQLYPLSYRYAENVFFIEDENIPETIATRLGIKVEEGNEESRLAMGAVFGLDGSYAGWTSKALWDWLRRREL